MGNTFLTFSFEDGIVFIKRRDRLQAQPDTVHKAKYFRQCNFANRYGVAGSPHTHTAVIAQQPHRLGHVHALVVAVVSGDRLESETSCRAPGTSPCSASTQNEIQKSNPCALR